MRRLRIGTKAPLAVAGLLAVPVYFASLLASSLLLDHPRLHGRVELQPSSGTETKIWAAALVAPGIVMLAGLLALPLRRLGIYLVAVTGIAVCLVLPHLSHGWVPRHVRRFPLGMDFLKDSDPSNLSSKGEWESAAQDTIGSITHWTLVLAVGAIIVAVLLEARRRAGRDAIVVEPPPAAAMNTGGSQQRY